MTSITATKKQAHPALAKWDTSDPYKEIYRIPLGDSVVLLLDFGYSSHTSFSAYISILGGLCPEATLSRKLAEDPNFLGDVKADSWYTIAQTSIRPTADQDKYTLGLSLIESVAQGDWNCFSCLKQENRSTSIQVRGDQAGHNTRFWVADLTQPELAKNALSFPLEVG